MAEKHSSKTDILNFSDEKAGGSVIDAETMRKLLVVFNSARKSVCKVKPVHKNQGTGAFYKVVDLNDIDRFIFMTCNHVLPTNSINEISQAILEFEDIQQLRSFSFNKTDVKYNWTTKIYDATIIEISIGVANLYKHYGVKFLKVGQHTAGNEVAILQYPKGRFGIAHGIINHINGNDVFYQIGTAPGSSGSPLLNWNCKALAMHKAVVIGATEEKSELWRKASSLTAIVAAYLKDQTNDRLQCASNNYTKHTVTIFTTTSTEIPKSILNVKQY